jgi:large conductance mechanosensitive channel
MRGFKNFLMRGDVIVVAVGLVIALAFSALITSFTTNIINRSFGHRQQGGPGLPCSGNPKTSWISARSFPRSSTSHLLAVVYFLIVGPTRVQARRGQVVFGDPAPVKTCPACLSSDLPAAASKCKYCGTEQPVTA